MKREHKNLIFWILGVVSIIFIVKTDAPFFWGIGVGLVIYIVNVEWRIKNPRAKDSLVNLATASTIILTIVLISISAPIIKPRVEIISINQPHSFFVTEEGGAASRTFSFLVTKPLIPLPNNKVIKLGNKIYNVWADGNYSYGAVSLRTRWYLDKEHNLLIFKNSLENKGYEKEIVSLEIATDYPFQIYGGNYNITHIYENKNNSGTFVSSKIEIYNPQNISFYYYKNISLFINSSTSIYFLDEFGRNTIGHPKYFLDYFGEEYNKGCFWLSEDSVSYNIPEMHREKNKDKFIITFRSDYIEMHGGDNEYYLLYYPECNDFPKRGNLTIIN